jgi:outer membrane protein assembly factor BamB
LPAIFLILRVAADRLSSQMHHLFKPGWLRLPCFRPRVIVLLVFVAMWTAGSVGQAQNSPTNKWLIPSGFSDSSPAIGTDGTIYLGTFNQKLWAVAPNGVPRWQFKTGSEIKSSPAIGADGTVYFGCRDRKFFAVSPEGKKKWAFTTGAWVDSSPALGRDGTIYFGSWDKHFYALNPDGTLKWQFATGGEIVSSPAVGADENIYFGSHDKKLYALAPDGRKRWEYATGGPIVSSPALNGAGVVYFTSLDGFCYALNEDGSLRWRLKTGGATESSPVIGADGMICVGVNSTLWVITPEGTKRGEHPPVDRVRAAPTVVEDNVVYVVFGYAWLFAVDADQHNLWSFCMGGQSLGAPGIGTDGSIYITGDFKVFCALDTHRPLARTPWPKFRANARNTGHVNETSH